MSSSDREALRQRYLKVDTATVSDVLDRMGVPDQGLASAFTPFPADCGRMAGWAYTIRGQMTPYEGSGDPDKMKAVDGVIVVPAAHCESVLAAAEKLTAIEIEIRKELDAGASLADVLKKYGHV